MKAFCHWIVSEKQYFYIYFVIKQLVKNGVTLMGIIHSTIAVLYIAFKSIFNNNNNDNDKNYCGCDKSVHLKLLYLTSKWNCTLNVKK